MTSLTGTRDKISITAASEHNLRSISLEFPKNRLIVVTGVSGSGKSSLIFDVLYREAESRYLGSFSSFARQFMGKMRKPDVEKIEGISPAIALDQKSAISNPRSTVGTITGIYDSLRLLFARAGAPPPGSDPFPLNRSLFSFNSAEGACPDCKGLGIEDFLDSELLIANENLTLREGALVITTPNGYIIYSQVTMDVLDQVCRAEGFHVDIPWKDLTPEQKYIVLYGSDKIEIPYGKHPLESRMKWSGITAKPREMGYYKGIIPVMETILQRDRNKNILRFVRTGRCRSCNGQRLNQKALSVSVGGYSIATVSALQLNELDILLQGLSFDHDHTLIAQAIIGQISRQIALLSKLGLKYLSANRESTTLSAGESQRLRLANIASLGLSGMIYILDEPSIGLHPYNTGQLIGMLKEIRDRGNTVIVVEHDEEFIRHADWLIDIGPGAGIHGGEVIYNGPADVIPGLPEEEIRKSRTLSFLLGLEKIKIPETRRLGSGSIIIEGATANNLKGIAVMFRLGALNVVTGVSGAGKSSLTNQVLAEFLNARLNGSIEKKRNYQKITGWEKIGKLFSIDQSPIGRTPRSNPATYAGVFDLIRDLFARQPEALAKGYDKSRFSFNTQGGRCEACQGAGYRQIGMHFMGNVEVLCESCEGRRFDDKTLEITFLGKNISEILEMAVTEALVFFQKELKIARYLTILDQLGLGYLTLGQRSSTLSGGEAQRIKLATELAKPLAAQTLYIMDEPTTGLHQADVGNLLMAIEKLIIQGHTVILIEHHPTLIYAADHIIDLGPGSGCEGGTVVATGTPEEVEKCNESLTGMALKKLRITSHPLRPSSLVLRPSSFVLRPSSLVLRPSSLVPHPSITLKGVSTHNLRQIELDIPHNRITVITGVSGSGKSSLAFDTIHAEAQNRFMEGFSTYIRSRVGMKEKPDFESITGLTPTLALGQSSGNLNPRSTVGTITGIYDLYRLLYSRLSSPLTFPQYIKTDESSPLPFWGGVGGGVLSTLFSFNHQHGACHDCKGLGEQTRCDVSKLITHPNHSILDGAMDGTKTGKFYGDPYGQYTAYIRAVGTSRGIDFSKPWRELANAEKELAMGGSGDELYEVTWEFKRNNRTGEHRFTGKWQGLLTLVETEYLRKHADHRAAGMMNVMSALPCLSCNGARLKAEALNYKLAGFNIANLTDLVVEDAIEFFASFHTQTATKSMMAVAEPMVTEINRKLKALSNLGLSYLAVSRPFATLSAGEARRVKLASQIGSGLTGITYILDEPTAGLHPDDTVNLMNHIRSLCETGNTVIIVEHDREVILAADHIIDLGPGAGINGGRIVSTGAPEMIMQNQESLTGRYLRKAEIVVPSANRQLSSGLQITGAVMHNLKGFDLDIPAGGIIVVTGVSGSGKSSLVFDLIYASAMQGKAVGCSVIKGFDNFSRIVAAEHKKDFTAANSIVATYTGLLDFIRDLFAQEKLAISAGITRNHFSFLNKAGQCPYCEGRGFSRTSMDFLPDVVVTCERCNGSRYADNVLEILYRKKNIAGVLGLTVGEAIDFFHGNHRIGEILQLLSKIGLDYLTLGQSLATLSGGEGQRMYLATEMIKPAKGASLYLFDEPSAGLHFYDIAQLLTTFKGLVDKGHSLLIIEHDPLVIAHADYVIELGAGGGEKGGYLIKKTASLF